MSILKLGSIDLVTVVHVGNFLRLFHLVFDADSISTTTKIWIRPLVVGESDFKQFKGFLEGKGRKDDLRLINQLSLQSYRYYVSRKGIMFAHILFFLFRIKLLII